MGSGQVRHRPRSRVAALGVALALVCGVPAPATAATVGHFSAYAAAEALVPTYVHPPGVWYADRVCIAFQGRGYDPMLATYDPATGAWTGPARLGGNDLTLDSHGAPALFEDAAGNLHAIFGSHHSEMLHVRTASPGALDSWMAAPSIDAVGTYPQVTTLPGGDVVILYRGAQGRWYLRTSPSGSGAFGTPQQIFQPSAEESVYASMWADHDGRLHVAFLLQDAAERDVEQMALGRHDAYYLVRDSGGTWRNAGGAPQALPITPDAARAGCLVYASASVPDGAGGATREIVSEVIVRADATGAPMLLFLRGSGLGDGRYAWCFARFTDGPSGGWHIAEIITTDHGYDGGDFTVRPDGTLEAFLTADASDPPLAYRYRGGGIGRWTSEDGGATWTLAERTINPPEPMSRFCAPFMIEGAPAEARVTFIEWSDDWSNFFQRAFLWGDAGLVERDIPPTSSRLAGPDRVRTAIEIARASFPEGADAVLLATAADFPDALAGIPLANALNGPVLLTPGSTLTAEVRAEITRLSPRRVVLLGGSGVVSEEVRRQVSSLVPSAAVERLAGPTRYDTMLAIARRLAQISPVRGEACLVSGADWPDAVSAASLAAVRGWPVILTRPEALSPQAAAALTEWDVTATTIVGGTGAVSAAVEAHVPGPLRIGGADRYETAAMLATDGLSCGLLPHRVVLATGSGFPDALVASGLAARLQAPVLLTPAPSLAPATAGYLASVEGVTVVYIAGGTSVVSAGAEAQALELASTAGDR